MWIIHSNMRDDGGLKGFTFFILHTAQRDKIETERVFSRICWVDAFKLLQDLILLCIAS